MNKLELHNSRTTCVTKQRINLKITITSIALVLVCVCSVIFSYNYYDPSIGHSFDKNAECGVPNVEEENKYSTVTVTGEYKINICAAPRVEDNNIYFYLSNPKSNKVWFKAQILDQNNELLAETGILKQDQYISSIKLEKEVGDGEEIDINLKIISFEPRTWESMGNINLKMTINGNR